MAKTSAGPRAGALLAAGLRMRRSIIHSPRSMHHPLPSDGWRPTRPIAQPWAVRSKRKARISGPFVR